MSKSAIIRTIRIFLFVEMVVLVVTAMSITRDYQDSWILEGMEVPLVIFMATNIIYFLVDNDNRWLVIFATMSRSVVALLPNLKYNWFLGTAIDQHVQFRYARFLLDTGHIETGTAYSETPIMHVLFAGYSELTGIPILYSFKFLPVVSWLIYPAIMYSIVNKTFPIQEKQSVMKFALLISSIPVTYNLSYLVTGSLYGSLFVFLTLAEYLAASKTNDRRYVVLSIVFGITLIMTHFVSSVLLMIGLFAVLILNRVRKTLQLDSLDLSFPVLFITLELTWIMTQFYTATAFAGAIELTASNFIRGIMGMEPRFWSPTGIRVQLFDLGFFDIFRVVTVFHGGDIAALLLGGLGIIAAKKLGTKKPIIFLILYFLSLWFFVPFQLILTGGRAGLVQYFRVIRHTLVICPILGALFLGYLDKRVHKSKPLIVIILSLIFALGTIETYGYQPFLPPSSSVSPSLPSDEPIVFLTWIGPNSIYQRSVIHYVEKYAPNDMQVASDDMTYNQIVGLASYVFSDDHLTKYNPLPRLIDEDVDERDYDVFLIHLPGRAGGLAESAESRTTALILKTILDSDILYTNGESFVLIYPRAIN